MTDEDESAKRQAELLMIAMAPHMTQIAVTQAVVAALVSTHPNAALIRERAESLLMQSQVALAITGSVPRSDGQPQVLLPDSMKTALDFLFRPVKHLDPD